MSAPTPTLGSLLPAATRERILPLLSVGEPEDPTPWYLKVPVAAAAWTASFFLCAALAALSIFFVGWRHPAVLGVWLIILGSLGILAALGIHREAPESLFAQQGALAISGAGHLAVILGACLIVEDPWPIPWVAAALSAALFPFQRYPLHRFLSVLSVILAATGWCFGERISLGIHLVAAISGGLGFYLLTAWPRPRQDRSAIMALVVGSAGSLVTALHPGYLGFHRLQSSPLVLVWISGAILGAALLASLAWFLGGRGELTRPPWSLATTVLVGLGLLGCPGILLALGLLVLGFSRRDRPLTLLGVVFLPLFLASWYQSLSLSLLTKSLLLTGSGVTLLLARLGLGRGPSIPEGGAA